MAVYIRSVAKYVPEKILNNHDLSKMIDTSDEWIREHTGMVDRRIAAEGEETSDMSCKAGLLAIEKSGLKKSDIDCLIVATCTPDQPNPSTACITQAKLELPGIPAFDIAAMCSGFLYGLQIVQGFLESGIYKNVLLIGAEKISQMLDWTDRTTCILFGDGAGAAVVSAEKGDNGHEILGTYAGGDGRYKDLLQVKGKPPDGKRNYLEMQGKELFKHAVRNMVLSCNEILQKHNVKSEEINWVVPHQANIRILETTTSKFNVPLEKCIINLEKYGNTSAASIPLALVEGAEKFKKGDIILCPAFGGGLTWAATLMRW